MFGEKHDLETELPKYADKIASLKESNSEFRELYDRYHRRDQEVWDIEEQVKNTSDYYLEDRKKERLALKDQLYAMLRAES